MLTIDLRTTAVALVAAASLACFAVPAHAQPAGGGAGGSGGCNDDGHLMDNGQIEKSVGKYERNTRTCTDGTVCTSTGTLQKDGTRHWTYECHDAPMARTAPSVRRHARTA